MGLDQVPDHLQVRGKSRVRGFRSLQACGALGEPFQPDGDFDHQTLGERDAVGSVIGIHDLTGLPHRLSM